MEYCIFAQPYLTKKQMTMKATEQTIQQIDRFFHKVAEKFPATEEASLMTDIHVRATQDSGELTAFDDEDNEITRCVVEQWIDCKEEDFYDSITLTLCKYLKKNRALAEGLGILKPYSFVLENDDKEHVAELFVADDDTIIVGDDLMKGLNEDLDAFFNDLMK